MLLRNATILLALIMCLAQNLNAQNFYYGPVGKVELEISTQKILVQFNSNLNAEEQLQILSKQKNYLNLASIQNLPAPRVSILALKNMPNLTAVNTLLQSLRDEALVDYANYFLIHPDGTFHGVTNQVLLRLKSADQKSLLDQIIYDFQGVTRYTRNPYDELLFEIKVHKNRNALTLANEIHESEIFDYCEPDFLRIMKKLTTNDPSVNNQWSLQNDGNNTVQYGGIPGADMNVFNAWNTTTGDASIKVAIIDEGVDLDHPDLAANLLLGFDATGQGSAGGASGDDAHGTACAGIVAAVGNNNLGGAGVAYNCKIIPVRIAYSSGPDWITNNSWITNAINWSWQNGNADVLSNSWGGGGASSSINNAIDGAVNNGRGGLGSPVFFAAGNDNGTVFYPATYESTISVIAMSMCNQRKSPTSCDGEYWWGSNYGITADIAAPGVKIFATDIAGASGYNSGDYISTFNGTSSACPNAAGVMALILSNDHTLTAAAARYAMESTADKVGNYNYSTVNGQPNGTWSSELGYGKINAASALGGGGTPPVAGHDAGISAIYQPTGNVCYFSVNPIVTLKNYGTNDLTSVIINYEIDGIGNNIFNWTGNLTSGATTDVTLPNLSFWSGNHLLNVATSNPNFQIDANPSNDAHSSSFTVGGNNMTLTLTFDANPEEISWDIRDNFGTIILSGNNYTNLYNNTITEILCLENGCYDFTIYDAAGNGMCCSQGNGSYNLQDNTTGNILASGGSFGAVEMTNFCLPNANNSLLNLSLVAANNVTCFGGDDGMATMQASGGSGNYYYLWSHGATGATISNLIAGTYSVTASDGSTEAYSSVVISEPSEIMVSITSTNSNGNNNGAATASASGGNPSYIYQWSNGATGGTINNLSSGTYTVTVTDDSSCTQIESVLITEIIVANLSVVIVSITNVLCHGNIDGAVTVVANGGTGNYTYNWSNGSTGATLTDLPAGNYTVTATDGILTGMLDITIYEPLPLTVQVVGTNVVGGNNGSAIAMPQGGSPDYFYLWSNGSTDEMIENLAPGNYSVTVSDINNCEVIGNVEILNNTPNNGYCPSAGNDSSNEWIHFLSFGSIQNLSGNNGGYADFTSMVTELERNANHPIKMAPGFSNSVYKEAWKIWIDFNRDFDFDDPGEEVFFASPTSDAVEGDIAIPFDAPLGLTRMRVSMKWNGNPSPCEFFEYGEVEDYAVFIIPDSNNDPCAVEKIVETTFEDGWGIWVDGGEDCRRSMEDHTFANSGDYCIRLRDDSENSMMTSENFDLTFFETITVGFSFYARSMNELTDDFWLQISRDGGSNFELVEEWNFGDEFINDKRYDQEVEILGPFSDQTQFRFRCDAKDDQDWIYLDDVNFRGCKIGLGGDLIVSFLDVGEPVLEKQEAGNKYLTHLNLFPNPASKTLNASFYAKEEFETRIKIFDFSGEIIFTEKVFFKKDKHSFPVDVSQFEAGIYVLSFFYKDKMHSKKFIIE
jgi:subtilisin family serine protease